MFSDTFDIILLMVTFCINMSVVLFFLIITNLKNIIYLYCYCDSHMVKSQMI